MPYTQLNEGSFVNGRIMRVSPELQEQLRKKHPELAGIPEEFVLKTYKLRPLDMLDLFPDNDFSALSVLPIIFTMFCRI